MSDEENLMKQKKRAKEKLGTALKITVASSLVLLFFTSIYFLIAYHTKVSNNKINKIEEYFDARRPLNTTEIYEADKDKMAIEHQTTSEIKEVFTANNFNLELSMLKNNESADDEEYDDHEDDKTLSATTTESLNNDNPFRNHKNFRIFDEIPKIFVNTQTKLQNGKEAGIESLPWTVALFAASLRKVENKVLHCAGTLITKNLIVSAAHCVPNKYRNNFKITSIRLGEYNTTSEIDCNSDGYCTDKHQEYYEGNFTINVHEDYNNITRQNDIALIRLNYSARTNQKNIKPLRLPLNEKNLPDRVEVAGWGYTEKRKQPDVIMKGFLDVTSYNECHRFYKNLPDYHILALTKMQFCGKGKHEVLVNETIQTCNGDSGSGAVAFIQHYNQLYYVLSGITSWGVTNAYEKCGHDRAPTVFVNIYEYINWIMDHAS